MEFIGWVDLYLRSVPLAVLETEEWAIYKTNRSQKVTEAFAPILRSCS